MFTEKYQSVIVLLFVEIYLCVTCHAVYIWINQFLLPYMISFYYKATLSLSLSRNIFKFNCTKDKYYVKDERFGIINLYFLKNGTTCMRNKQNSRRLKR